MILTAHAPLGRTTSPEHNAVLAQLAAADLRLLHPLEHVRLPARRVLLEPGEALRYLYLPTSGVISLVQPDEREGQPEIVSIGAEGMLGASALLGCAGARHRAFMQTAGAAYRTPLSAARDAFEQSRAFRSLVLAFANLLLVQLSQKVLCKLSHTVEQQLGHWLLAYCDRLKGAPLEATQEQIAEALGSRRQGVSEAMRRLQGLKVIACTRGRISVLDRAALERHACGCYRVIRDHMALAAGGKP